MTAIRMRAAAVSSSRLTGAVTLPIGDMSMSAEVSRNGPQLREPSTSTISPKLHDASFRQANKMKTCHSRRRSRTSASSQPQPFSDKGARIKELAGQKNDEMCVHI